MSLQKETKAKIVKKYGESESDTGSTAVQVALLTKRIEELQNHFKDNKKDNHSRTGLLKIVSERKKLLNYLMKKNEKQYHKIVKELKLRD
jgi:small subunit ribosomal protein S15